MLNRILKVAVRENPLLRKIKNLRTQFFFLAKIPRDRSQTTLTDFGTLLTSTPSWLTALLNKICDFYLVMLTFGEPPSPLAVNIVCECPLAET